MFDLKRLHDLWQTVFITPGFLSGHDTMDECMKDDAIRTYLSTALSREIIPLLRDGNVKNDPIPVDITEGFDRSVFERPLLVHLPKWFEKWASGCLPLAEKQISKQKAPPHCITFSLSCAIMIFASLRENRYLTVLHNDLEIMMPDTLPDAVKRTFTRLSCDMAPDALAYAVLHDWDLWDRDIAVPELEDAVASQLGELQLIGVKAALKKNTDAILAEVL